MLLEVFRYIQFESLITYAGLGHPCHGFSAGAFDLVTTMCRAGGVEIDRHLV